VAKNHMRRKKANQRSVGLVVIVTAIIVLIFTVGIIRLKSEEKELENSQQVIKESIQKEEERKSELEQEKDSDLDLEDIIAIAREKFRLIFPNEIIFVPDE